MGGAWGREGSVWVRGCPYTGEHGQEAGNALQPGATGTWSGAPRAVPELRGSGLGNTGLGFSPWLGHLLAGTTGAAGKGVGGRTSPTVKCWAKVKGNHCRPGQRPAPTSSQGLRPLPNSLSSSQGFSPGRLFLPNPGGSVGLTES